MKCLVHFVFAHRFKSGHQQCFDSCGKLRYCRAIEDISQAKLHAKDVSQLGDICAPISEWPPSKKKLS